MVFLQCRRKTSQPQKLSQKLHKLSGNTNCSMASFTCKSLNSHGLKFKFAKVHKSQQVSCTLRFHMIHLIHLDLDYFSREI